MIEPSMEVEISWRRTWRIWWAYAWRNLLMTLASMVAGGIVGFIVGFLLGLLGVEQQIIQYITGSLGFVIGFLLSVLPMRMILGKNFGDFRLVLIRNTDSPRTADADHHDKSSNA